MIKYNLTTKFLLLLISLIIGSAGGEVIGNPAVDSLIQRLSLEKNDSLRYDLMIKISEGYMLNDLSNAIIYSRQAREAAEKTGSENLISESIYKSGKVYFNLGLIDSAAWYFQIYLDRIKDHGTAFNRGMAYNSIGAVYLHLKDNDQAQKYFERSLKEFEEYDRTTQSPPMINKAYVFNNLGLIAKEKNEFPKALYYLNKGIRFANKFEHEESIKAMLYNNLGNVLYLTNHHDSALTCYFIALRLRLSTNDMAGATASYRNIGNFYILVNNHDSAIFYMQKAFREATAINSYTQLKYSAQYLYEIYDKARQPDSALKYLKIANDMKEKEQLEQAAREMAKRESLNDFLEKERKAEAMLKQDRYLHFAMIVVFSIVLAFVFYRYLVARRKIRDKQQETEQLTIHAEQILNEKEQIRNEKEQIRSEFENVNRHMTIHSMKSLQKEKLISQLAERLNNMNTAIDPQYATEIGSIIKSLDKTNEKLVWKEFEYHFMQIHPGFYDRLNAINPKLSVNDKRLCAFLKMGLSTKEISDITGRTIDSINKSRIRLRQKLNITNNSIRITEFLNTV